MIEISLEGLLTVGGAEDRALAMIKVNYNGNVYDWKIYVPQSTTDLTQFLEDIKPSVQADIDAKETIWANLTPKTREIESSLGEAPIVVDIDKSEIVCPTIPDYYALRRAEYPSIGEQLGALYKGVDSTEYLEMQNKINAVKLKYPKPGS